MLVAQEKEAGIIRFYCLLANGGRLLQISETENVLDNSVLSNKPFNVKWSDFHLGNTVRRVDVDP